MDLHKQTQDLLELLIAIQAVRAELKTAVEQKLPKYEVDAVFFRLAALHKCYVDASIEKQKLSA